MEHVSNPAAKKAAIADMKREGISFPSTISSFYKRRKAYIPITYFSLEELVKQQLGMR